MGRTWAAEVAERNTVEEVFLVVRKAMPMSRNGKPYLNLQLADRTGKLDARLWENANVVNDRFEENDFVRVKGTAVLFQERIQLHITTLEKVADDQVNTNDFLPRSRTPPERLWAQTQALLDTIQSPSMAVGRTTSKTSRRF